MKLLMLTFLFLTTLSHAAETQLILDLSAKQVARETFFAKNWSTNFWVDYNTNEVFGHLEYTRTDLVCTGRRGHRQCDFHTTKVKTYSGKIDGTALYDDKIISHTATGEVECGVVKPGRIFRSLKTIVLTGNCQLDKKTVRLSDGEERLQFFLLTK